MKYTIGQTGFVIGQYLLEPGTVIDSSSNDFWSVLARGRPPPPNSVALDEEAYATMLKAYGAGRLKFHGVLR
jgi:hypothetical protein